MEDIRGECPGVVTVSLDLTDWSKVREVLTVTFQDVDIDGGLVNNAGIVICKPFEDITEEDYDK